MGFFSEDTTKLWKIGKHRVKKIKVRKQTHRGRHSPSKKRTRYKCVDCERTVDSRESFESDDYTCYDVIQE